MLKKTSTLTGEVIADIFASTTGTDNDMVVKLIDQYPDDDPDPKMRGYQLMTNAEIFRGRYLSGFDKPQPLRAGLHPRIQIQPSRRGSRLQGRPHRHGRNSEHLVPALRPQSRRPSCPTS